MTHSPTDEPQSDAVGSGEGAAGFSRRGLLSAGLGSAVAMPLLAASADAADAAPARDRPLTVPVELNVNGRTHRLQLDPRTTLLDTLREHLGLTGAKRGCDHGQCGACTVHIGGRRALACMTLAVAVRDPVVSIEGLAAPDEPLHPMQLAFITEDAFQCGYCTPGQIMSAIACVREGHASSDAEIRDYMSGNLCRCGAYTHIVAAIRRARGATEHG